MGKRAVKGRKERRRIREEKRKQNKERGQKIKVPYNEEERMKAQNKEHGKIYLREIEEFKIKRGIESKKEKNPKITDKNVKEEIRKTQEVKRKEFLKGCMFSSPNERREELKRTKISPKKEKEIAERLEGERKDIYLKVVLKKLEEANRQDDQEER